MARGLQPPGLVPEWVGDFAIADKLGVPVAELEHQPARLIYRATVLLDAEGRVHQIERDKYRK